MAHGGPCGTVAAGVALEKPTPTSCRSNNAALWGVFGPLVGLFPLPTEDRQSGGMRTAYGIFDKHVRMLHVCSSSVEPARFTSPGKWAGPCVVTDPGGGSLRVCCGSNGFVPPPQKKTLDLERPVCSQKRQCNSDRCCLLFIVHVRARILNLGYF